MTGALVGALAGPPGLLAGAVADDKVVDRMLKEFGPQGVDTFRRKVSDDLAGHLEAALRVVAGEQAQPTPAH